MFETNKPFIPMMSPKRAHERLKVFSAGFDQSSLEELDGLLLTLGVNTVQSFQMVKRRIDPRTFIGKGKLEELKDRMDQDEIEAFVVDEDLSPNQLRNIEKFVGRPVIDRSGVILEIFARHAQTQEAKTQVELARLEYLMPRLAHFWTHFERQRGGKFGQRGMGEKQLESRSSTS